MNNKSSLFSDRKNLELDCEEVLYEHLPNLMKYMEKVKYLSTRLNAQFNGKLEEIRKEISEVQKYDI